MNAEQQQRGTLGDHLNEWQGPPYRSLHDPARPGPRDFVAELVAWSKGRTPE